jgi:tol-pal system protein YbgF
MVFMRKIVASLSTLFLFVLLCAAPPAHAVSKEMVQLQTQVQQLQDALQHLQETQDQQMSVMQHVVQQISDSVAHISSTMTTLQQQVQTQNESGGGKIDQVSGQMQGINDSVDALRTRIDKLSAQVAAVQSQLQNIATQAAVQQQGGQPGQPSADPNQAPQQQQQQPQAPPVNDLYQGALRDYNSARYDLAAGEFGDVLKYYPQDDLAGNAQFYLGEIAYRQGKYADAIKAYGVVLQQFAGNSKAPAAELRKGEAELSLDQRDNGIRDLRELIARYPQTPEASQARSRLNGMGVRPTASKPTAYHE